MAIKGWDVVNHAATAAERVWDWPEAGEAEYPDEVSEHNDRHYGRGRYAIPYPHTNVVRCEGAYMPECVAEYVRADLTSWDAATEAEGQDWTEWSY